MSVRCRHVGVKAPRIFFIALVWSALAAIGSAERAAADGVREIDQTCATWTGCFPSDAPGFPVTIDGSAGRSYRLTTSLVSLSSGTPALVQIDADDVTLDLNGFELTGCTTDPCTPSQSFLFPQSLISGTGVNVAVRNGRLRGAQVYGIHLPGAQQVIERVSVGFVAEGVVVGPASIVFGLQGASSTFQSAPLVSTGAGSLIEGSQLVGFFAVPVHQLQTGSLLDDCTIHYLTFPTLPASGIAVQAAENVRISRCRLFEESTGAAISAASGASIAQNLVRGNVVVGSRSHVQGNLIDTPNAGASLELGQRSSYRDNVVFGLGAVAPVSGASFQNMGANACNGSIGSCP